MKKRLALKKLKQRIQEDMLCNVWDIDETEDRTYDEWKDNVAMGYEQKRGKENDKQSNSRGKR